MKKIYETPAIDLKKLGVDFLEVSTGSDIWKKDSFDDGFGNDFGASNA